MKPTLLTLAVALVGLTSAPTPSNADTGSGGFFANFNVGQSNLDNGTIGGLDAKFNGNDTGYGANVGYRWTSNPSFALGVEGGYTMLGTFDPTNNRNLYFIGHTQIEGWNAGVDGHFNFTPNWYLSGRAGLFHATVRSSLVIDIIGGGNVNSTSNKYYAGAGFGYDFSNNMSVGLKYDYYKVDDSGSKVSPSLVSVSAEYRF